MLLFPTVTTRQMKISMGIASPLFCESETELVDIELLDNVEEKFCTIRVAKSLPAWSSEVLNVKQIDRSAPAIDQEVCRLNIKSKF